MTVFFIFKKFLKIPNVLKTPLPKMKYQGILIIKNIY